MAQPLLQPEFSPGRDGLSRRQSDPWTSCPSQACLSAACETEGRAEAGPALGRSIGPASQDRGPPPSPSLTPRPGKLQIQAGLARRDVVGGGGSQEPRPPLGSGLGFNSAVGPLHPLHHWETRTNPSLPKAVAKPLDLEVTQRRTPLLIPTRATDPRAKDLPAREEQASDTLVFFLIHNSKGK